MAASTARDLLGREEGPALRVIHNGVAAAADAAETAPAVELFYAGLPTHRKRVLALPFVLAAVRRTRLRCVGSPA